ncbi:putative NADPH-cytochrome P450 reductase [Mycosarcoma maydis]|uniref:NADPH--cytochrome P450 reductase n=1 Tax=Mycosarcoma maydis TaxID=5270 RepID=A0A0D1CA24_MYCMD|nr:putative NADPH-cytochrome P450 reductase [Ustilago maydis 521]KIS70182.1 putative NADPH-cytochrome P450 reductase [Ustilago maydis 521]|eukprot:XP_011388283.1 putative NADPH-cytochrome P450 reductase [Ustilago maydis 521]
MASQLDLFVLGLGGLLAVLYLFRDSLFGGAKDTGSKLANGAPLAATDQGGADFVSKLKSQNKRIAIFYGSQTGTAEEYATKLAKEAKARFGTSSLVLDPEEYEFDKLDQMPQDTVAVFVMATYGEGEPTDNAVGLMEFIENESPEFSNGSERLENLNYVIFGLGNRTYEHFNAVARKLDARLQSLGAKRIGERGEGDDDKSMEEDYLAWKDSMFEALATSLNFEEGGGGDVPDFKVTELANHPDDKVYHGELSARALLGTKGIHDAKNPYNAVVKEARELFVQGTADRTCVHIEFDIDGSGISYQHGDHIAVWAHNPEPEVDRVLAVFGLLDKRTTVIDVESLDPTLAKVPFPVPTTYEAVFRHYIDITSHASRQTLNSFAKFAPSPDIQAKLEKVCANKDIFQAEIGSRLLKTTEAMQWIAGDDLQADVSSIKPWNVPFDRVISDLPRVGPRFYSISSSPKMHPKSVHITAVVLRYQANKSAPWVHGLATNLISSIKMAKNGEQPTGPSDPRYGTPKYLLDGPRGAYTKDGAFRAPIHIRRSNFRLPTSPKIPVIMVGPGTGVAPFRSFVQDRVCSAEKALEKSNGKSAQEALKDWGNLWLFYGCRKADEDFLYRDEWPQYAQKLGGKFIMETSLSREKFKPDGSKLYVQDLIWERRKQIAEDILERKAYIYICGEAKGMAHDVEAIFGKILEEAKGSAEEAKKEIKLLKERSRLLLDVWS